MLASFNGHTEVVTLLLQRGASAKATDSNKRTALMFASSGPFPDTVKTLLKAGSEVNAADGEEAWTALIKTPTATPP
jgi:ankyrin repeat protein